MQKEVKKINKLNGEVIIPSDKSISHRAAMFLSLAKGVSTIENFSKGADCHSTLYVLNSLGVKSRFISEKTVEIDSTSGYIAPKEDLYCGNSGTTMRLMSGVLAGQNFDSVLTGDESLSKRPMKRVIEPLSLMGALIDPTGRCEDAKMRRCVKNNIQASTPPRLLSSFTAPLKIHGQNLHGIDFVSKLASAQVKSCVLLAGLHAQGKTSFAEPYISRNHTELMLEYLGANISCEGTENREQETASTHHSPLITHYKATIQRSELRPKTITVPGDISSAAFFIVAGLIVPNSEIILKNVGLNPTRTGILDIVKAMGADVEILDKRVVSNEEVGDIKVKYSQLLATVIEGDIIPRLIDELPVIAVLATQAQGDTVVKDADDLRNKESDRIKAIVTELRKIGADIDETEDGFVVHGKKSLKGDAQVETYHDHRLAMSLYVAGLVCQKPVLINEFQWVDISFPEFEQLMTSLQ